MPTPIAKAAQDAEGEARLKGSQTLGNEPPPEVAAETTIQEADPSLGDNFTTRTPIEPDASDRIKPVVRSPKDEQRDAIIARFRQDRQAAVEDEADSDAAQIRKFTREGMPPELDAISEPAEAVIEPEVLVPEPEPAEPEPVEPQKVKVKVRGVETEITLDEAIAAAQKSLAADTYLEDAKSKLREVDSLLRATQQRATRPAQPAEHHGEPQEAQTGSAETTATDETGEHPADAFAAAVEKIQYGDPKEAAASLQQLVAAEAGKQSKEALRFERTRNDEIRSQKVLKDFMAVHPDLANDEFASAAIEKRLFNLQKEDLLGLGIDDDKLPQNPAEIAKWHQYYRVEGHNVRNAETLLTTARDDFMKWKGPASVPATQPAAVVVQGQTPKIAVTVDRTARRAAIPQQPTRTGTPKPDNVTNPVPVRERSDIVQQMKLTRAKPRQQILG